MPLSRSEVEHVARLAHVGLHEDEIDELTVQLSSVVDHIARLQELDVTDVPPTAHVLPLNTVLAEDSAQPSWPPSAVLVNAPRREDDFFAVQAVLD